MWYISFRNGVGCMVRSELTPDNFVELDDKKRLLMERESSKQKNSKKNLFIVSISFVFKAQRYKKYRYGIGKEEIYYNKSPKIL